MEQKHTHADTSKSGLNLAFGLNLVFSIIELIGGILTNSTAIIADAFHDFMDAMAIGVAILVERISGKKRTDQFSYGYRRFSLLSAVAMSAFLLAGSVMMTIGAIRSFINPEVVNSTGMLWLALLGVSVNGIAFFRIKNGDGHHHHAHAHTHLHNHSPEPNHAHDDQNGTNHNSKAIMLHLLEDVLGWIAVLIGAAIIHFTGWYWIDGVLTLGIAGFIGFNATRMLIATFKVLLQSVPENVNIEELTSDLNNLEGVQNIHDLHVWSMDGSYNVASLHAVVNPAENSFDGNIYRSILLIMKKHHIQHPTVQLETSMNSCNFKAC